MTSPNITDAHVPKLNNKGEPTRNDMTEHEVIKRDAIRLAAVVVNLSKKYRPFPGYRALNTRQLSDLEHVCQELRTVYARLLAHERSALAQEMMDDPDLGLEQTASPPPG